MSGGPADDRLEMQRQQFEENLGFAPTRENVREHVVEGLAATDWLEFPLTEEFDWNARVAESAQTVADMEMVVVWSLEHLDDAGEFPLDSPADVADALVGWLESEGVFG